MFNRLRALALVLLYACAMAAHAADTPATTDPKPNQIPTLPLPANPALPSVFLIGDSTVRNGRDDGQGKGAAGQWGWGNPIAAYFDAAKVNLVNRAIGGLSSRTYLTGGHWERTLALVKPGDVVIMQFGHNDSGAINDNSRARATIKGTGEESQDIDNMLTGLHETVHSYGWYLRKFIADARAKGAIAIVCSPIPRKNWDANGAIVRASGDYSRWAADVAQSQGAPFIDLNELIARRYDELGHDAVMQLFPQVTPDEHTHTNLAGAELNARIVVAGLKVIGHAAPAVAFSKKADDVAPADLTRRVAIDDRPIAVGAAPAAAANNPALPTLFIVGDSTVKSGGQNGAYGWGEQLAQYLSAQRINVANHAIGGRSSRTFYTEGRWETVRAQLRKGDFVLIQFGHNDGGKIGDPAMKRRASAAGIGAETVADPRPDGSVEQVHSFGWYMSTYVADARAKGATVVILSPVPHRDRWQTGRDFTDFAAWDQAVAEASGARFIDLTMLVSDAYRAVGAAQVDAMFADARTHTNDAGARFNAARVIAGLKGLPGNPLGPYFSAQASAVAAQP